MEITKCYWVDPWTFLCLKHMDNSQGYCIDYFDMIYVIFMF